jgi:hypothetical protein
MASMLTGNETYRTAGDHNSDKCCILIKWQNPETYAGSGGAVSVV